MLRNGTSAADITRRACDVRLLPTSNFASTPFPAISICNSLPAEKFDVVDLDGNQLTFGMEAPS
jgi:hypothetical protein